MKSRVIIPLENHVEFAAVCASLVKEGIVFDARISGGDWVIEFSGGY